MNDKLAPEFAAALRSELVARVDASSKPFWKRRRFFAAIGASAIILTGSGVATATLLGLPGSPAAAPLGTQMSFDGGGSDSIDIGRVPSSASHLSIELSCLTSGTFTLGSGESFVCSDGDVGAEMFVWAPLDPVSPSQLRIQAEPDDRWQLRATFVNLTTIPWATNERGLTYGVINSAGSPDLVAVEATNGRQGFVYATELARANGDEAAQTFTTPQEALAWQESVAGTTVTLDVFETNGLEKIGDFLIER